MNSFNEMYNFMYNPGAKPVSMEDLKAKLESAKPGQILYHLSTNHFHDPSALRFQYIGKGQTEGLFILLNVDSGELVYVETQGFSTGGITQLFESIDEVMAVVDDYYIHKVNFMRQFIESPNHKGIAV